ncbi:Multiple inositol polyphosphate phosphatase 1 [Entamoeba marina]
MIYSVFFSTFLFLNVYSSSITHHFQTATAYPFSSIEDPLIEHYQVVHAELLNRHGSRYPTSSTTSKMSELSEILNKYSNVHWENPFSMDKEGQLCDRGKIELQEIGMYYRELMAELFENQSIDRINVSATYKSRTQESAKNFLYGFYANDPSNLEIVKSGNFNIIVDDKDQDIQLYFHKNCQRYVDYSDKKSTNFQMSKYVNAILPNIRNRFMQRIKMEPNSFFDIDMFKTAWEAAKYEYIVFNTSDSLLPYFTLSDAKIFDYIKDLGTFYTKGMATPLNYRMAIPLLTSILNGIERSLNEDKNDEKQTILGNFRFAHAETVTPLMTLLGLNVDKYPLRATSSISRKSKRQWRMSKDSPFATHSMFVLLKDDVGKYFIRLYFNQKPVVLPACPTTTLCPVTSFFDYYNKVVKDFNFYNFCAN